MTQLLSAAEQIDALAARGIMLYLGANGELRARCEPCFAHILDAARPMLGWHREEMLAYLEAARRLPLTLPASASRTSLHTSVPCEASR